MNRALLSEVSRIVPSTACRFGHVSIAELPLYDADLDTPDADALPQSVQEFRARIGAADGLLMAVAEYNRGPSGVLKNAIDWASRPVGRSALADKPIALVGVSMGPAGTGRAQLQLRQNLLSTASRVVEAPVVTLGFGAKLFDARGRLVDAEARESISRLVQALLRLIDSTNAAKGGAAPDPAPPAAASDAAG